MKISTKGRYGLRILLDIALYRIGNKPRMIREIANNQEISEKYISRLMWAEINQKIRSAFAAYTLKDLLELYISNGETVIDYCI